LRGYERMDARALVREKVDDVLDAWRAGQSFRKDQGPPREEGGGD
jgi:hypothetical protein